MASLVAGSGTLAASGLSAQTPAPPQAPPTPAPPATSPPPASPATSPPAAAPAQPTGPHLGNLYPFVQRQADTARHELSFLKPQHPDLRQWQQLARPKIFELLLHRPDPVAPSAERVGTKDRGDYIEEYLTFLVAPDVRIPAYVLLPKEREGRVPGILALHSHDGLYLWGKEKLVPQDEEHAYLSEFKKRSYGDRNIAAELARRGCAVLVTDMLYWGERRMVLDDDPPSWRQWPPAMTREEITQFNRRASQNEALLARSLFTAGSSWAGINLWDDMRALDYLASRPEVDANRLGCVGLSVGGYRSFMLAALDERIKVAVDVGWMTSYASQIRQQVINTIGFSFTLIGLYRYMDFPDVSALIAPRALMVINGSRDRLFSLDGVKRAFERIAACYQKAGAPERQRCLMYDTPHEFNQEMQAEAWKWMDMHLRG